jgi:hypothetical protein
MKGLALKPMNNHELFVRSLIADCYDTFYKVT